MRFKREDLPGILIAALAPAGLFLLFLASFEVWSHQGTPLLGAMSANIAVGAGLIGAFSRFIRRWDLVLIPVGVILGVVAGVNWAQHTGNDGTALATALKWIGVLAFLAVNLVVVLQLVQYGLLPILDRRDARRAAERDAAAA